MRKVILKMSMSLDGFVGTPSGEVEWIFRSFDDQLIEYMVELLWQAGTHIMGRVTYHDMAAYWPTKLALDPDRGGGDAVIPTRVTR